MFYGLNPGEKAAYTLYTRSAWNSPGRTRFAWISRLDANIYTISNYRTWYELGFRNFIFDDTLVYDILIFLIRLYDIYD